jgi:DNA-binding transcriptional LysR family regulator
VARAGRQPAAGHGGDSHQDGGEAEHCGPGADELGGQAEAEDRHRDAEVSGEEQPGECLSPAGGGRNRDHRGDAAGRERQVSFEVAGFGAAADLVRNGLGIAFLPASEAARLSDLTAVELTGPALIWRISVAAPAHRRVPAAARAFLDELLRDTPRRLTEPRS